MQPTRLERLLWNAIAPGRYRIPRNSTALHPTFALSHGKPSMTSVLPEMLAENALHPLCKLQLSPAVAMFGSATPSIGQTDAELLAQTLLATYTHEIAPTAHDYLVQDQPLAATLASYEEGYDLALDLLETLGLPGEQAQGIDAEAQLGELTKQSYQDCAGFSSACKARNKGAHSKLCNPLRNTAGGRKDKQRGNFVVGNCLSTGS